MAEIGKGIFKHLIKEEERKALTSNIESEEACKRVASLYSRYVNKYSGRNSFFLTNRLSKPVREKRLEQIRKLIRIANDLGVPVEVYIKAQFEEQMVFLRTRGLRHVPFANLISDNAVRRFDKYKERIDLSYSTDKARKEAFYSTDTLKVREAIQNSMEKFYARLERVKKSLGTLEIAIAIIELEVMAKANQLSNIYIYCSPLVEVGGSEYLSELWAEVDKKLNEFEKKEASLVRKEFLKNYKDEIIKQYV